MCRGLELGFTQTPKVYNIIALNTKNTSHNSHVLHTFWDTILRVYFGGLLFWEDTISSKQIGASKYLAQKVVRSRNHVLSLNSFVLVYHVLWGFWNRQLLATFSNDRGVSRVKSYKN